MWMKSLIALAFAGISSHSMAAEVQFPVSQDSYVSTYNCCGVEEENFGSAANLSVGQFNRLHSQAWLAFDLSSFHQMGRAVNIRLKLPQSQLVANIGAEGLPVHLSMSTQDWDENTLTWSNRPAVEDIGDYTLVPGEGQVWDLTDALLPLVKNNGLRRFTLIIDTKEGAFFLPSKEDASLAEDLKPHLELVAILL